MFRYLYVVIILLLAAMLFAEPEFYPMTQVGEAFLNTSNAVCNDAVAGLNIVEDQFHNGEFFSMRYYSQSTGLSNPFSEARVDYYDITAFPTVIFNGTEEIIGGGPSIINGSEYAQLINQNRFAPSPIMMQVIDFNSFYGTLAVTVTMKSSTYSIQNQSIHFVLVQNGLPTEPTNIIREVITQPITLSGLNSNVSFNVNFDTEIYGIVPEYWVAAFVQLDNGSILQAVSILSQPTYQIRAAMPFSPTIIDSANINYNSETVWFYNLGQADNYTIRLLPDNNPADWYLNYCNETGGCFPGDIPNPFSLASGEVIGFHLNLLVGKQRNFHLSFHCRVYQTSVHISYLLHTRQKILPMMTSLCLKLTYSCCRTIPILLLMKLHFVYIQGRLHNLWRLRYSTLKDRK